MGAGHTMLDLTQILRDLESPIYGTLSHVVGPLMRVIRADGAVALIREQGSQIQCVYVGSRGLGLTPEQQQLLRKWPTGTRSNIWRQDNRPIQDDPRLLIPDRPTDAERCREVTEELLKADIRANPTSLRLALSSQPLCLVLFLRRENQPPFVPEDLDRLERFTDQASRMIQQGHHRELRRMGRSPDSQDPIATILPIEELLGRLSATEHIVLKRLQQYETERQIAETLERSPNTIHVHVKSIYRKLMVTSRKQLLLMLDQDVKIAPGASPTPMPRARSA